MLNKYSKTFQKIAMGLLNSMSIENDLQVSKETIRKYEERDNYHLYFWKEKKLLDSQELKYVILF